MQSFVQELEPLPHEDANLLPQLQQLESALSGCAREASKDQVFVRMGYMASELKRLASKVHKNEQRTSFLQVSEAWMFVFPLFFLFFFILWSLAAGNDKGSCAWWTSKGRLGVATPVKAVCWGILTLLSLTLQTLCETLHTENKELRTKLERDLEQRNQALEKLR